MRRGPRRSRESSTSSAAVGRSPAPCPVRDRGIYPGPRTGPTSNTRSASRRQRHGLRGARDGGGRRGADHDRGLVRGRSPPRRTSTCRSRSASSALRFRRARYEWRLSINDESHEDWRLPFTRLRPAGRRVGLLARPSRLGCRSLGASGRIAQVPAPAGTSSSSPTNFSSTPGGLERPSRRETRPQPDPELLQADAIYPDANRKRAATSAACRRSPRPSPPGTNSTSQAALFPVADDAPRPCVHGALPPTRVAQALMIRRVSA